MRLLSVLLLAGCASTIDMGRAPPADWPAMKVEIYQGTIQKFDEICGTGIIGLTHRVSCAHVDFAQQRCWIMVRPNQKLAPEEEAHEREHCAGRDHPGESTMRDGWERYKLRAAK